MIHVSNLTKEYAGRVAVDDISFDVQPGEVVGFLGPTGAGKSTTMRILSGYMPPTSGLAMVGGHNVFEDSLAVRRQVGYMPESAPLYLDMRVKEYLHFRGALKGLSGKDLRVRTGEVMEMCAITDVRRRMIANLSKGYRQRVALADALIHRPPLLILDEPTNGLDPTQIRHVRELVRGLRPQHTVLLSTHILHEVELTCDRVIMIHHGRIKACDTPRNLTRGLRAAGTVYVELQGGKDVAKHLDEIPGVRKVVAEKADGPWQAFSLRIESNTDVREAIQELAMKEQWRIRELHRKLPTLEDVFIELAAGDAPARAV
ncbi:MAG: type transport system ATP-binding protein [Verrucomicrobiaceae bacterium]|nr:type transport system ATP-binding protein [Verrucomicrobiaceae bacterium]